MTSDVGESHFLALGVVAESGIAEGTCWVQQKSFGPPNGLYVDRTAAAPRRRKPPQARREHCRESCNLSLPGSVCGRGAGQPPPHRPGCSEGGTPYSRFRTSDPAGRCGEGISQPGQAELAFSAPAPPPCPPVSLKGTTTHSFRGAKWMLEHF